VSTGSPPCLPLREAAFSVYVTGTALRVRQSPIVTETALRVRQSPIVTGTAKTGAGLTKTGAGLTKTASGLTKTLKHQVESEKTVVVCQIRNDG
jgi:hypothetical protein